jgi:hypothetical protein
MHYQRQRLHGALADNARSHAEPEIRFMRRVEKHPGGCWLWRGAKSHKTGYGSFQTGGKGSPTIGAHRFSYQMHKGPVPKGKQVLHSCDVRLCVNPDHLRVGTHQDNMDDMTNRGRRAPVLKGAAVKGALLDEGAVRAIRSRPYRHGLFAALAVEFVVDRKTISDAYRRKTWAHLE